MNNITFAIKNKKTSSSVESQLLKLGVKKNDILSIENLFDLKGKKTNNEYFFVIDEDSVLVDEFSGLINEIELSKEKIWTTLVLNKIEGNFHYLNKSILSYGNFEDLVGYLEMTSCGIIIPVEVTNEEWFSSKEGINFYNDFLFYKGLVMEGEEKYELQPYNKVLLEVNTKKYDYLEYQKEDLDRELNILINE